MFGIKKLEKKISDTSEMINKLIMEKEKLQKDIEIYDATIEDLNNRIAYNNAKIKELTRFMYMQNNTDNGFYFHVNDQHELLLRIFDPISFIYKDNFLVDLKDNGEVKDFNIEYILMSGMLYICIHFSGNEEETPDMHILARYENVFNIDNISIEEINPEFWEMAGDHNKHRAKDYQIDTW